MHQTTQDQKNIFSKLYVAILTQSHSTRLNIFQTKWIAKVNNSPYFDRAVFVTDGSIDFNESDESQNTENQNTESQNTESQNTESQNTESQNTESQNKESQNQKNITNHTKNQSFENITQNYKIFVLSIPDKVLSDNVKQVNKTYRRKRLKCNADKQTKFNYSMYDFITNSDADWMIYIDNDAGVVPANFDSFMENLNQKYNPKKEIIFRGSGAFSKKAKICFPGGGLGMLLSRKAVIETFKVWPKFFLRMDLPEDMHMTRIVHYFRQTMLDFHINGFSTGLKNQEDYFLLANKQYDQIPLCPLEPIYPQCSSVMSQLNKLVFYHRITSYENIEKLIEEGIPDEVKLVHTAHVHKVCWEDKEGNVTNPNRTIIVD